MGGSSFWGAAWVHDQEIYPTDLMGSVDHLLNLSNCQLIGFREKKYRKIPLFMGTSMVSGVDLPVKSQPIETDLMEFWG